MQLHLGVVVEEVQKHSGPALIRDPALKDAHEVPEGAGADADSVFCFEMQCLLVHKSVTVHRFSVQGSKVVSQS